MAKFEVTLEIEGHNENEVLSNVYKALYTGDLDAESVRVRPVKKRGQGPATETNPRVARRLLGQAVTSDQLPNTEKFQGKDFHKPRVAKRLLGQHEPDGDPDVSGAFTQRGYHTY